MQYMLTFYNTPANLAAPADPVARQAYYGAWGAYMGAMEAAGVMVNGHGLQPPHTATTLRMSGGKRQIQDGPFADSKEQLGGYFVINVASLDEALEWAARSPAAVTGAVEVRPCLLPPETPQR